MFKNVASQKVRLYAYDYTTGQPKTGDAANITAYVSKDHGSVTVLGDTSATEADATNAPGSYLFDLTQGETNADNLAFSAKSSTSNIRIVPIDNMQTFPASFGAFVTPTGATVAAVTLANDSVTAAAIAADAGAEIADAVLNRDMSTGTDSGSTTVRTMRQALRAIRNKIAISAGTLTVYKEDDATTSWSAAVSTDVGAEPIIGVDPAGP